MQTVWKEWRARNPQRMRAIRKRDYQKNREAYIEKSKKWRLNNQELYNFNQKDNYRRRKQREALGEEWIDNRTCFTCYQRYLPSLGCLFCSRLVSHERRKTNSYD